MHLPGAAHVIFTCLTLFKACGLLLQSVIPETARIRCVLDTVLSDQVRRFWKTG